MFAIVTGAAGFVGSHLSEHLVAAGDHVCGIDAFTEYYERGRKEENIADLCGNPRFSFIEGDLTAMPLAELVERADIVYHLAGQPGVRSSWGSDFALYMRNNILATERLLEACRANPPHKLVYASSSSVYGDAATYPTSESTCPRPVSPYGVTKLAAEHLCEVFRVNYGVPTASLRLFTVYGPRQRPDMAFARLVECGVGGGTFELYGDGEQTRDCTYVGDVVRAMRRAAVCDWTGLANVGGGLQVRMNEVIELLTEICGSIDVLRRDHSPGDVRTTGADTRVATEAFGYEAQIGLHEGLRAMVEWRLARKAT